MTLTWRNTCGLTRCVFHKRFTVVVMCKLFDWVNADNFIFPFQSLVCMYINFHKCTVVLGFTYKYKCNFDLKSYHGYHWIILNEETLLDINWFKEPIPDSKNPQWDSSTCLNKNTFTGAKLGGLTRLLAHPRWRTSEAVSKKGSVRAVAVWIELNVVMEYHVTNISPVIFAVQRPPGHVRNVREV